MDALSERHEQHVPEFVTGSLRQSLERFRDAGVAAHRNAELQTLLSPELAELVRAGKIRLVTYQQLVARTGLAGMHRPSEASTP